MTDVKIKNILEDKKYHPIWEKTHYFQNIND